MKGFKSIPPSNAWDGDIVAVKVNEVIDNDFPSKKWNIHFAERTRFFSVRSAGNNTLSCVDCHGRRERFGWNQIVRAYRKEQK